MTSSSNFSIDHLTMNNLQQNTYLPQTSTEMGTYGLLYPWYSLSAMGFNTSFNYPLSFSTVPASNNTSSHAAVSSESPPPVLQPNITPMDYNSENTPNLSQVSP
uniref:OAR domain-containing protein n=1 Tax=Heterorhabditis bacteriophora TaxID=37862 RepID=A0A1I7XKB2_HETBA